MSRTARRREFGADSFVKLTGNNDKRLLKTYLRPSHLGVLASSKENIFCFYMDSGKLTKTT